MAVNLRTCVRALVVACCVLAGGCTPVLLTGDYTPKPHADVTPEFPVVVRYLGIRNAYLRDADGNYLWPASWRGFRDELEAAVERDLYTGGPFRAPLPGEAPYMLDVWLLDLDATMVRGYIAASAAGGILTAGVPFLLGMPVHLAERDATAVFHLYDPDGTLVLEKSARARERLPTGVYYPLRKRPLGGALAPLVHDLETAVAADRRTLRAGVATTHYYAPDARVLANLRSPDADPTDRERFAPSDLQRITDCLDDYLPEHDCTSLAGAPAATPATAVATAARTPPPPPPPPPPPVAPTPTLVAAAPQPATLVLAIGIDRYRDAPPADGAEADARRVGDLFARTFAVPDDQRRVLLGDRATRSDIDEGLRWLAEHSRRGARAVVYFSGHGAPHPTTGQPLLVPYEADPADVTRTALPLVDLERRLAALPAKDAVLIVDACFSGQGARSLTMPGARPLVFAEPRPQVIRLAAAAASETASATPDNDGGLFTHYLLEGLGKARADADGDGRITLAELAAWLTPRVHAAARARGRDQTPSFAAADARSADVVLGWGYPQG